MVRSHSLSDAIRLVKAHEVGMRQIREAAKLLLETVQRGGVGPAQHL